VTIVLLAFLISTLFTIATAVTEARNYYNETYRWRDREYKRLSSLHGGLNIEKFHEILGTPVFITTAHDGVPLNEATYKGRDYWVQAIFNSNGMVLMFSVTACEDFNPTFVNQIGKVTLGRSRMAFSDNIPGAIHYNIPGATANAYLIDEYYLGNPGNYKTYYFGLTDACGRLVGESYLTSPMFQDGYFLGWENRTYPRTDYRILEFRQTSIVNTYGETAPFVDTKAFLASFQIGPNRILTRTLQ
jgi:hypothetical protein